MQKTKLFIVTSSLEKSSVVIIPHQRAIWEPTWRECMRKLIKMQVPHFYVFCVTIKQIWIMKSSLVRYNKSCQIPYLKLLQLVSQNVFNKEDLAWAQKIAQQSQCNAVDEAGWNWHSDSFHKLWPQIIKDYRLEI